jgi:hypothetical protein
VLGRAMRVQRGRTGGCTHRRTGVAGRTLLVARAPVGVTVRCVGGMVRLWKERQRAVAELPAVAKRARGDLRRRLADSAAPAPKLALWDAVHRPDVDRRSAAASFKLGTTEYIRTRSRHSKSPSNSCRAVRCVGGVVRPVRGGRAVPCLLGFRRLVALR